MKQIGIINGCVIDQHIDLAQCGFDLSCHLINLLSIRYVSLQGHAPYAVIFLNSALQFQGFIFGRKIVDDDVIPLFSQLQGNCPAYASGCSGNKYRSAHNLKRALLSS